MATISDVARRAGVTTATVSNVLTGRVTVREATRLRVLRAIKELDYRPNLVARGLAQGKTRTIAIIVPTISNLFFAEVVEEVERVADQLDYQTLLCTLNGSLEESRRRLSHLSSRWVDGLLIMGMSSEVVDWLMTTQKDKPIVLSVWDQDERARIFPIVDIDFRSAGEMATRHLVALGHRRIGAIIEEPIQRSRLEGYQIVLAAAKIPLRPDYIALGNSSFESGYQLAHHLQSLAEPPTAIFAGNDMMALGASEALSSLGYRVPQDCSIVGIDDIALAQYAHPPLTTISIPRREMARTATEVLLKRIEGRDHAVTAHTLLVLPELVIRQSTAAPR